MTAEITVSETILQLAAYTAPEVRMVPWRLTKDGVDVECIRIRRESPHGNPSVQPTTTRLRRELSQWVARSKEQGSGFEIEVSLLPSSGGNLTMTLMQSVTFEHGKFPVGDREALVAEASRAMDRIAIEAEKG